MKAERRRVVALAKTTPEYVIQEQARVLRAVRRVLERHTWQHRCANGVGGCRAIRESARDQALKLIARVLA